jgi:hypothetical protein
MIPLNFGSGRRTGHKHWLELVDGFFLSAIFFWFNLENCIHSIFIIYYFYLFVYFFFLSLLYRHMRVCVYIFSSFILL